MRPFDALFMALAVGSLTPLPRWWWLPASVPVASHFLKSSPFVRFENPLTAIVACALAPQSAPVAFTLALPDYRSIYHAGGHAMLWLLVTWLSRTLSDRFQSESVPVFHRGLPMQWFFLAVLYYTLLPVAYL